MDGLCSYRLQVPYQDRPQRSYTYLRMHRVTGIRSLHYLFSITKTAAETGLPTNNPHEKSHLSLALSALCLKILSYLEEQTPIQAKAMHLVSCLSGLLAGITSDNHDLVSILQISKPMEHKFSQVYGQIKS
ncbi:hypothetical protein VNO77_42034 [Canavalia gladiata]|uniref:Uncharacterized protein n=1 Tax=Canavalia gladiata TaxID=3824 RepID=A0AAN9K1M0_CANGL